MSNKHLNHCLKRLTQVLVTPDLALATTATAPSKPLVSESKQSSAGPNRPHLDERPEDGFGRDVR